MVLHKKRKKKCGGFVFCSKEELLLIKKGTLTLPKTFGGLESNSNLFLQIPCMTPKAILCVVGVGLQGYERERNHWLYSRGLDRIQSRAKGASTGSALTRRKGFTWAIFAAWFTWFPWCSHVLPIVGFARLYSWVCSTGALSTGQNYISWAVPGCSLSPLLCGLTGPGLGTPRSSGTSLPA